jgi:plasmid stability protein
MAEDKVKLTVRLPRRVHQALRERAAEYDVSLNQALVEALESELKPEPVEETEAEKVRRVLREAGMLADTSWMQKYVEGVELPTHEEVREWLRGVPLSEWIIEDRGPR